MKSLERTLIGLSALVLAIGCGGGTPSGNGSGSSTPGDTCSPTLPCFDLCFCQNPSAAPGQCSAQCSAAAGGSGAGGSTSIGAGGTTTVGAGGTTTVGAGGTTTVGAGGTTTVGAGGTTTVGAGGTTTVGAGGTAATGGTTGAGGATAISWQELNVSMDTFTVPVGGELFMCQDYVNPFGKDVDILFSESQMTQGSHHMFAFRLGGLTNTAAAQCSGGGFEFHEYIHSAQTPDQITTYPAGVGRFMPGNEGIRMMVHYINLGTTPITAHVNLALHYVDPSAVQAQAAGIFLDNIALRVPPGASTATSSYTLTSAIKLIGGVSHMHKHAIRQHTTAGSVTVFDGTDWNEPKEQDFWSAAPPTPAMDIAAGTTITWACDYQNATTTTFGFGESASLNEMCIYSGVYYPAPGGASIVINN